ncbi:MAG: hypothetical protein WA197_18465 [Candidatus Acidiferrales bacterium]
MDELDLIELEHSGVEVLYIKLHQVDASACEGPELSLVFCQVLRTIADTVPGGRRNAMLRHAAGLLAERRFCQEHWDPIDRLLRQLITIWKVPIQ